MVENARFGVLSADITSDAVLKSWRGEISRRLETRCAVYSAGSDNVVLKSAVHRLGPKELFRPLAVSRKLGSFSWITTGEKSGLVYVCWVSFGQC